MFASWLRPRHLIWYSPLEKIGITFYLLYYIILLNTKGKNTWFKKGFEVITYPLIAKQSNSIQNVF